MNGAETRTGKGVCQSQKDIVLTVVNVPLPVPYCGLTSLSDAGHAPMAQLNQQGGMR